MLRWIVCAAAVAIAAHLFQGESYKHAWLFVIIAVIFNPIAPIHFDREVWRVIDALAALPFIGVAGASLRRRKQQEHQ